MQCKVFLKNDLYILVSPTMRQEMGGAMWPVECKHEVTIGTDGDLQKFHKNAFDHLWATSTWQKGFRDNSLFLNFILLKYT